jgi:hypothetical protein
MSELAKLTEREVLVKRLREIAYREDTMLTHYEQSRMNKPMSDRKDEG